MADDKFRRQLAQELDLWLGKDWINPQQRDILVQHYQLDRLKDSARSRFATVLLLIGALLVGLGIIVFVAANWAEIPPGVRAIGAVSLMVGLQTIGFSLWRSPQRSTRLATTLLFVGQMALGASIGLVAQWLQVSGAAAGLFLAWSGGVLAMAYGLRHAPTGALALVLWLVGCFIDQGGQDFWIYQPGLVPWFTALFLFPLAYWCRSRWIFALTSVGWLLSVELMAWELESQLAWSQTTAMTWAYVFALPVLLGAIGLWCWSFWHQRHLPWLLSHVQPLHRSPELLDEDLSLDFGPTAQALSLFVIICTFYGLSFREIWLDQYESGSQFFGYTLQTVWLTPQLLTFGLWALALLVIILWLGRLRYSLGPSTVADGVSNKIADGITDKTIGITVKSGGINSPELRLTDRAIGLSALSLLILLHTGALWGLSLILINLGLFVLGSVITWQGLQLGQRWRYWLGLLTLALQILTRFFEYDTGLLVKSAVLVLCGIGVIFAGLRFEEQVKGEGRLEVTSNE